MAAGLGHDDQQVPAMAAVSNTSSKPSHRLPQDVLAKREARLEQLKADSDEKFRNKKRRRRTRGWAGLPADPEGPPRFPSETTIHETMGILNLSKDLYKEIREQFTYICQEMNILKKTAAGDELWRKAKDRLIMESPHLQNVFFVDATNVEKKQLALEVVCIDVTKRIRTLNTRMTIVDAKNALGINPDQSRDIRDAFYNILKADHFTSKLACGEEHWKELKDDWIRNSPLLQQILALGDADPQYDMKLKACECLCRDVMKRLRDDQTQRDPSRKRLAAKENSDASKNSSSAAASQPSIPAAAAATAPPPPPPPPPTTSLPETTNGISNGISTLASQALAQSGNHMQSDYADFQIDPTLIEAANADQGGQQHQSGPPTYNNHYPTQPSVSSYNPSNNVHQNSPLQQQQQQLPTFYDPNIDPLIDQAPHPSTTNILGSNVPQRQ